MTMIADTLTALGIYSAAMATLGVTAYYLRWDRHD
jgi:hypothetical protein